MLSNSEQINAMGIDFGTSRYCAATNIQNYIRPLPIGGKNDNLMPSCVIYDEKWNARVAEVGQNLWTHSKYSIFDFKNLIGKEYSSITKDETWQFDIINSRQSSVIEIKNGSNVLREIPEQIVKFTLKTIKARTEECLGKKISNAVVTVPTKFTEKQQEALHLAGILAGFDKIVLIREPIAAVFAYFDVCPNDTNMLLFDLGGGKLDVCVAEFKNNEIRIFGKSGGTYISGKSFDNILLNYFKKELGNNYGITNIDIHKLMIKCQEIKHDLSLSNEARLDVEDFDITKNRFIYITIQMFENLSRHLFKQISMEIEDALKDGDYKPEEIKNVFRYGGGCRMPRIQKILQQTFPTAQHHCQENFDEIVAIGAAHHANNIFR